MSSGYEGNDSHPHETSLSDILKANCGESVLKCYQCGKCSAGCPLASEMDIAPSMLIRKIQTRLKVHEDSVLSSYAIWLCLTCETCVSRCPKEVDLPKIMDFLREESLKRNMVNPKAKDILAFHNSFLESVKYTGRLYEVGMVGAYKLRTWHFLQDLLVAPKLFLKGKLGLLPHLIKGNLKIRNLFDRITGKKED